MCLDSYFNLLQKAGVYLERQHARRERYVKQPHANPAIVAELDEELYGLALLLQHLGTEIGRRLDEAIHQVSQDPAIVEIIARLRFRPGNGHSVLLDIDLMTGR